MEDADVWQLRNLAEEYPDLSPRDLMHLSVMSHHRISTIITADRGFDGLPGIQRIDLAEYEP